MKQHRIQTKTVGITRTLFSVSISLLAIGCATGGSKPNVLQKTASTPSSIMDSMDLVLIGSETEACIVNVPASTEMKTLVAGAGACARAKNWKATERYAGEIARRDLGSPWAPYFMSVAAAALADSPRSLWMAELAQKKAGNDIPLFRYQRGRALLALGRMNEAFAEIDLASRKDARLVEGVLWVGEVLMRDRDAKQAEDRFRHALLTSPDSTRGLRDLAAARAAQGDDAEALRLRAEATQIETRALKQASNQNGRAR